MDDFDQLVQDEISYYEQRGESRTSAEVLVSFRGFINHEISGINEREFMKALTREDILNCEDIKIEVVNVPEWGGCVSVKAMTGQERDAFEASIVEVRGTAQSFKLENIRSKLVSKTVVDPETKKPLFTVGDIEALGKKSAAALDRIFSVSQKLSKITSADVEELAKN